MRLRKALGDSLVGPFSDAFTLDGDQKYMYKFHAARGTGRNAGHLVALGDPTV